MTSGECHEIGLSGVPIALMAGEASLPQSKPDGNAGAQSHGTTATTKSPGQPSRQRTPGPLVRGNPPGIHGVNAEADVGVELILVSAAYIGVMATVFTKGVAQAARTHRNARPKE